MKKNIKNIVFSLLLSGIIFTVAASFIFSGQTEVSVSERRKLSLLPSFSVQSFLSGDYAKDFEKYSLDQFPLREKFRTLKSLLEYYVFFRKDNNGVYISGGSAVKQEYPLNTGSVENAAEKFTYICDKYNLKDSNRIFLSVIPDKAYFTAGNSGQLSIDYSQMLKIIKDGMPYAEYIDIFSELDISDYYKTDSHWRQEEIGGVAEKIADSLGKTDYSLSDFSEATATDSFYGVYYGQSSLPLGSEKINYLTDSALDNCTVYYAESDKYGGVYDFDAVSGRDPYEFFLSGAQAVIDIKNPAVTDGSKLIIFRDSYANSLTPLLIQSYSEITLIDIRYIASDLVGGFADFNSADILFLYSTTLLNNSFTFK